MTELPNPPEDMMQRSDDWAYERKIDGLSGELESYMLSTYYQAFSVYQQHRRQLKERIDEAGGVAHIAYVGNPMFDSEYRVGERIFYNEMRLNDGSSIPLEETVAIPPLSQKLPVPDGLPKTATRTHEVQLSFGGEYLNGRKAEEVFDLDDTWLGYGCTPFETLMQDPTYFPEDMAITERVVTNLNEPFDKRKLTVPPHVVEQSFSLIGRIWRPHLSDKKAKEIPDPYADPLGYRRWALQGDAKIDLEFQAPTAITQENRFGDNPHKAMKTVIEAGGHIVTEHSKSTTRDVLGQFQRFMELVDLCYVEYVPEEEREAINEEINQIRRSRVAALPDATDKRRHNDS